MSQVKYKFNDDEDFLTVNDYNHFIERIKENIDELENEDIITKSEEGKILNEKEFNNLLKEDKELKVEIEIDKKKKKKIDLKLKKNLNDNPKIETVNLNYKDTKKTIKLESYTQLLKDIKKNYNELKDKEFVLKEENNKTKINNKEEFESVIQKLKQNQLNFIIEEKNENDNEKVNIIIKYNNEKKNYPLSDFNTLISKIQNDFTDFAISDFDLIDSNKQLITEDNFKQLIKNPQKNIKIKIIRKNDEKKSLKYIKVIHNRNKRKYTENKWSNLTKAIESDFNINLENYYILDDNKNEVKNEKDFEKLKSKKSDSNIILNLIQKFENKKPKENDEIMETPNNNVKNIKMKIPQLQGNQTTELLLNIKSFITELIEAKFNEVNNTLKSMNEKIDSIYNELQERKNLINQNEESTVSNIKIQNLEENLINLSKYIKGDNEKEIVSKIKDLNKEGKNPIKVETTKDFKCDIHDIMNNSVNYEITIFNESDFDFPKRLKLKCHKDNDLIVYFNDIIINDGEPLKSKENCTVVIPLLYNTSVEDFYPNTIMNFYLEKFNENLYEGIAEIYIKS